MSHALFIKSKAFFAAIALQFQSGFSSPTASQYASQERACTAFCVDGSVLNRPRFCKRLVSRMHVSTPAVNQPAVSLCASGIQLAVGGVQSDGRAFPAPRLHVRNFAGRAPCGASPASTRCEAPCAQAPPPHPRAKPRHLWSNTGLKRGCLGLSRLRESLGT
jgi:hypothetical protein